jgi:hypothetical protein
MIKELKEKAIAFIESKEYKEDYNFTPARIRDLMASFAAQEIKLVECEESISNEELQEFVKLTEMVVNDNHGKATLKKAIEKIKKSL